MPDRDNILAAPCSCGSGKLMRDCHFDARPEASDPGHQEASDPGQGLGSHSPLSAGTGTNEGALPSLARPPVTRRLDLACGQNVREGFEGVDIWPGAQHVVDLQRYPWPFEDESVLELNTSHYIEHIPMEMVMSGRACGKCGGLGALLGALHQIPIPSDVQGAIPCPDCRGSGGLAKKDALFAFFDECWRILAPDGWLFVTVPAHRNDRAFQDPTHRRFITAQTFLYMNEDWRRTNRLDHYNAVCNFVGD